jgi:hypothetical protein
MLAQALFGAVKVGPSKRTSNAHVGITRLNAGNEVNHVIAIGPTLAHGTILVSGTGSLVCGSLACHDLDYTQFRNPFKPIIGY